MRHSFLWVTHTIKKLLFGSKLCSHAWDQRFFFSVRDRKWDGFLGDSLFTIWPELCFLPLALKKKRRKSGKIFETQGQTCVCLIGLSMLFNSWFALYIAIIPSICWYWTYFLLATNFISEWYLSFVKTPFKSTNLMGLKGHLHTALRHRVWLLGDSMWSQQLGSMIPSNSGGSTILRFSHATHKHGFA